MLGAVQQPLGEGGCVSKVDANVGQPKVLSRLVDNQPAGFRQPPQSGTEVGVGAASRHVGPQHAGDVHAWQQPVVQSQEGDQPLRADRDRHHPVVQDQLEGTQQAQVRRGIAVTGSPPRDGGQRETDLPGDCRDPS